MSAAMKKMVFAIVAVLGIGALPSIAIADPAREETGTLTPVARQPPAEMRSDMLDRLFGRLAKATNKDEAQTVEQAIWKLWMTSDSPTAELLLAQAVKASAADDNETALKILNGLIAVHPEFMEAWNRRATVYYLTGRYQDSLADIDQVLDREPRHFGALSGLGMIKRKLGDLTAARAAFSDALAVNPNMDGIKRALDEIDHEERPL
jgi:tetratricopeptide (TPR) repeat protein